jgi:hypothetical protein
MGEACSTYGGQEWCTQGFGDRSHGKRPAGRPRLRWEDMIKKDLQEVGWRGTDWIDLAQDRDTWQKLRNAVKSLQVP